MDLETVVTVGDGPVRHLVLNRPERQNAFNAQMVSDVSTACRVLDADPRVRVVIVRGAGKSLSSGADLDALSHTAMGWMLWSKAGAAMLDLVTNLNAITICCCHGNMIGGGAVLPTACDFRLGAPSIRFRLNEVSLGFNYTWNALPALVELLGPASAKELLILGGDYGADELERLSFLHEVVEEADLLSAAERWAERVVRQPPMPVIVTKASINANTKALHRSIQHLDHVTAAYMSVSQNSRRAYDGYFAGSVPDYTIE